MLPLQQQQQQQRRTSSLFQFKTSKVRCVFLLMMLLLERRVVVVVGNETMTTTTSSVASHGALTGVQNRSNNNSTADISPLPTLKKSLSAAKLQPRKRRSSTGWLWDSPIDASSSPPPSTRQPQKTKSRDKKQVEDAVELLEPRSYFTFLAISTTPVAPTTRVAQPITVSSNCTCVPYYYCDEGQVVPGGIIDITQGWPCRSILEVCCKKPRPTPAVPTAAPPAHTESPPPNTVTALPGFAPKCGTLNPNGINARILGFKDSETQFGEYPWMAALLEMKLIQGVWVYQFVCGAALVWPSVVLTAAHCIKGKKADHLTIRLGEWDTESTNEFYGYQDIRGKEIVIHPQYYAGSLYSDIALIFLAQSAILAPHIDTICLPAANTPRYDNSSCWATGWGKNAFGTSGSFQAILKEVELGIVPRTACEMALRTTDLTSKFNLHSSFLCAGGQKGLDTCVGDGGGPLVCPSLLDPWRYELAGIVSWGIGCGIYGIPGVYVDTVQFRTWIDLTIATRIPNYNVNRVTIAPSTNVLRDNQGG